MLERYEKVKEYVYSQYAKIYNEDLKVAALTHTASVDLSITFIAMARGTNLERAKVAAIFHDSSYGAKGKKRFFTDDFTAWKSSACVVCTAW